MTVEPQDGQTFAEFTGQESKPEPAKAEATKVEPPKQEPPKELPKRIDVVASETGRLIGRNIEEQYRIAAAYSKSGLMPYALNTPEKVLVALQLCAELGLPPVSSISRICVVNGSPSLFGDLPLALALKSGKLKSIKEWLIDKDGAEIKPGSPAEAFGAVCEAVRVGGGPVVRSFTQEDAKRAGLWMKTGQSGKPTPWVLYPKRMLQLRARSHALKDCVPDVLSGVGIAEYDGDAEPFAPPPVSVAAEVNATYLTKDAEG